MRSRFPRPVLAATCALLALAGACRRGTEATHATKRIGVTLLTKEHDFYRELEAGLQDAAKQQGYELVVTSGEFDLAKQQSQIQNFVVQQLDAIIVCPVDSRGIAPAIQQAADAKIPVFTSDIRAFGAPVVSHVASNNLEGGRLAAQYLARALGEKGTVGIIGQPDVQSTIDREQGFREEMAKHPGITVTATLNGYGVRDRALKAAEDLLQAHADLKGVFAINDDSALGAMSAAEGRGRKDLVIVGFDASAEAQKAILGGTPLRADVAQNPRLMGQKTIEAIAAWFANGTADSVITVPLSVVDSASLAGKK